MNTAKIAITMDAELVGKIDRLVKKRAFANRSKAIQQAVKEKLERMEKRRLIVECAKLDKKFEQALADEGISAETGEWAEY